MRIIRGKFAGKSILPPKSILTRPTSGKVRQAIFNIIEHHADIPSIHNAVVLDTFAGTGALGLEALSRGAAKAIFVDNHRDAILNLYNIIHQWGLYHQATFLNQNVLSLSRAPLMIDIVFCDPPYKKNLVNLTLSHLKHQGWLTINTVVVAEMHKNDDISVDFPVKLIQEKRYGDTNVIFLTLG